MTTYLKGPGLALALAPITLALLLAGGDARAGITISIQQVGPDVVASEAGEIDLTGLTFLGTSTNPPEIYPSKGYVVMGDPAGPYHDDAYSGVAGPTSFGGGTGVSPTSGSGDITVLAGYVGNILGLPPGYVSGTSLTSLDTYSGDTISGLGLTPGTYTYTWGTGGPAHTLTVQIGPAAAVPEPSTAVLAAFGAVTFLAYGRSRHRRERRRLAAA